MTPEFLSLIDEKNHLCNVFRRRPNVTNAKKRRDAMKRVAKMKKSYKRATSRIVLNNMQEMLKRHGEQSGKFGQVKNLTRK